MRLRPLALAVLAGSVVPALALAAGPSSVKLETKLSGNAEVPKGAPAGKGTADVTITGRRVCWDFTLSGIDRPLVAHIHRARAGTAGPIVVPLGAAYKREGCTTAGAALARAIIANPAGYYVNVHTAKFPSGAVRGQLRTHSS